MNDPTIFDYAEHQLLHCRFMEPALRSAIASLALPVASHRLDAGCGPGGVLPLLAEAIGPAGLPGLTCHRPTWPPPVSSLKCMGCKPGLP